MFNPLKLARSTFCLVRATSAKFGLHAGNVKLNAQNEEVIILIFYFLIYNFTYNCTVLCFIGHHVQQRYADNSGNSL